MRLGLCLVVYDDEFYCHNLLAVGYEFFGSVLLICLFMGGGFWNFMFPVGVLFLEIEGKRFL